MSQHTSEHKPATDPPGAVSNQNGEEAESGHREDGTHPEPRTGGHPAKEQHNSQASRGSAGGRVHRS